LLWVIVLVFPQVGDLRMMDLSSKMMGVIKGVLLCLQIMIQFG